MSAQTLHVRRWVAASMVALSAAPAWAHKSSDSYLTLTPQNGALTGRWDAALPDLAAVIVLDSNADGEITWRELGVARDALLAEAKRALRFRQAGRDCLLEVDRVGTVVHSDGTYAALPVRVACPAPIENDVELTYDFFFAADPTHHGLIRLPGQAGEAWLAMTPQMPTRLLSWSSPSRWEALGEAMALGIHHLSIGWDHLCFLLALLLPSVLRREGRQWHAAGKLNEVLREVVKVVTSFTLAHSLTLVLAAVGWASADGRLVELLIAASVGIAAANNLVPVMPEGRWALAFSLGLLHGFGFVSALSDLGAENWVMSLMGFNLGVEVGQLMVVAVLVPFFFFARSARFYLPTLRIASFGIAVLSAYWFYQRW